MKRRSTTPRSGLVRLRSSEISASAIARTPTDIAQTRCPEISTLLNVVFEVFSFPLRHRSIPGPRPDGKRCLSAGTTTLTTQLALQIEEPGERRLAAHQQVMGDGRFVLATPAEGLDQVPGAEVLQTKIVARRVAHGSHIYVRSSF